MFDILKELKGAERIGISAHIRPDGDALGSCLGLSHYIKKMMNEACVDVILEQPTKNFKLLPGYDDVIVMGEDALPEGFEGRIYDAYFCLDCSTDRLGAAEPLFKNAKKRFHVDHHFTSTPCGDCNLVDAKASSTSELICRLIGNKDLDETIAAPLYVGIAHDTGLFRFPSTSPETLRIVADLISVGFDFSTLIDRTFSDSTYLQQQLLGRALLESMMIMDGKCIVTALDRKTMNFYGALPKHTEGIVQVLRNTTGVECAIFMYELDTLNWKVSLRSNSDRCNVATVAGQFGGGGHMRAAGCSMNGTFHDCINNITKFIEPMLETDEWNN